VPRSSGHRACDAVHGLVRERGRQHRLPRDGAGLPQVSQSAPQEEESFSLSRQIAANWLLMPSFRPNHGDIDFHEMEQAFRRSAMHRCMRHRVTCRPYFGCTVVVCSTKHSLYASPATGRGGRVRRRALRRRGGSCWAAWRRCLPSTASPSSASSTASIPTAGGRWASHKSYVLNSLFKIIENPVLSCFVCGTKSLCKRGLTIKRFFNRLDTNRGGQVGTSPRLVTYTVCLTQSIGTHHQGRSK
jgi:hypothetical protein